MPTEPTISDVSVEEPTKDTISRLEVDSWPIWEKEPSTFDWHYDAEEVCYFLEGKVIVRTPEGEVAMGKGNLVTFPAGLDCTWEVQEKVRKHYRLG